MKGLYKGKYLIAVYDKDDYLIDVGCNPDEVSYFKTKQHCYEVLNHKLNQLRPHNNIHLIDVTEKHEDVFIEEDELFIDFLREIGLLNSEKNYKEEAERLGVSISTYYEHKRKGTLYKLENRIKKQGGRYGET